jgi:CRP/FNR family transcriptional regulator, cyclic AMP receptor protein
MPLPEKTPKLLAGGPGPQARHLKRGDLLFAEGENSRAMFLIKSGMLRIFKKKGDANIEIDTLHSGQIVGELAFLDGLPRSASGEALTDTEVIEISGPTFQEVLNKSPEWMKILMKTIVGRLRSSSTRIRQLETASSAYDYSGDGKRSSHYVFLSPPDVLRILTSILLVAARGKTAGKGIEIRPGLLQRYANQIMGVPVAKITTMLDVLVQGGLVAMDDPTSEQPMILHDIDLLEHLVAYLNEENLVEPSKRHDLSIRGFLVMSLVAKNLSRFKRDKDGAALVNVAEIRKLETKPESKEPFRMEEFTELVKLGYASALNIKSNDEVTTSLNVETFMRNYRFQRISVAIRAANEQKTHPGK